MDDVEAIEQDCDAIGLADKRPGSVTRSRDDTSTGDPSSEPGPLHHIFK